MSHHPQRLMREDVENSLPAATAKVSEKESTSCVFYAMPFTGKCYEDLVCERTQIREKLKAHGLELAEQFIGIEEKEHYEAHSYGPLFIAKKDHQLLKSAGIVIADYTHSSIGRDCEIVLGKEVFDKRIISIVPDSHTRNHPWVRLYSDYIVETQVEAFELAKSLSRLDLPSQVSRMSREQKDTTDLQIHDILSKKGIGDVYSLFPTELVRRWRNIFGEEYDDVVGTCFRPLPKTLRVNLLRTTSEAFSALAIEKRWNIEALEFSKNAYTLKSDSPIDIWGLPEYQNGHFYMQQLASMLPAIALNPKPGEDILDIAAAPGSKTTQMAEMMKGEGKIIAIDISSERVEILNKAIARHKLNHIIDVQTRDAAELEAKYTESFDKVMVDVPCSCEGITRYKAHKLFEWNLLNIYRLTEIQKRLLESGFRALRPGGTLVYSTCTFGPEENEAIVDHLLKNNRDSVEIESIEFPGIKTRPGLTHWEHAKFDNALARTIRLYPQDNNSIGFFIAKLTKKQRSKAASVSD
jgi:tRNA (cytosine49-C5)-methyltransferase